MQRWRWQDEPCNPASMPVAQPCSKLLRTNHEALELGWWMDSVPNTMVVCFPGRIALKLQVPIGWAKDLALGHYQIPSLPPVSLFS